MSGAVLVLLLALGQHSPQQPASQPLEPALEVRVQRLGKQLRCAVCQGVSIADSPAGMARAQLDRLRELVRQGLSDQQIRTYFVERYGEWVLLEPEPQGLNWVVWLGPVALLGLGAWLIGRQLRRPVVRAQASEGPSAATTSAPEDPYLAKVRSELER